MYHVAKKLRQWVAIFYLGKTILKSVVFWGGGVQQQKRQRTSCDFPGGMIFFVLFLFSV